MASAFLSSILSKTSQVLGYVHRWAASPSYPRSSVLEDLEELERTLKRIQAVLHDAEEREIREEAVKLWLKELKEVTYDAEDVLDEYQYEVLRAQAEGGASRKRKRVEARDDEEEVSTSLSTIVNVSIPDGMGDRIRKIRKRFDEISEDRKRLRLREEDGERRVFRALSPPPSSHMVDESSIYGREHDKQKVIDMLFSEGMENGISVIPIVGKGGLGKTTIAQLVYNDSKVKEYFDLTGWVCVSDDFDVPRLTKAIIESITEKSCDLIEISPLQNSLKKKVEWRKLLLILDDVWNEQQSHWESLRIPFVGAETVVSIIVTCRNDSVAKIMQTVLPYHPGCLSEDESWSLFKHYAFGGRDPEEHPHLVHLGKQIVKKCSGLPLAVKTIGSLLRHEMDEDSWMEVLQSGLWELDKNNETLASLRLSYNRMPAHLKPCFIYCSMFPKDYEFDKDVLVRLWMAQGYIPPRGRKTMEDIGDECFNDLLTRSFFDSLNYLPHTTFKMHDMIHDLAKSIAGNECYAIVDKKLPGSPDKVRHLYVQGVGELVKSPSPHNVRALRTLSRVEHLGPPSIVIQEITQFSLLRCLEFWWEKVEIPDLLGNLKHLRYLHIRSYCIKKLPESVCLLYHLQTLILDCHALAKLPDGLGNLINLRCLNLFSQCIKRLPESVRQLRNLQRLGLNECGELKELPSGIRSLTNLRHLDTRDTQILCLPVGIEKLTNLQILRGRYEVQGGIGVFKDLVNLQGGLCIGGLGNLVGIEDAKDLGLKYKHKLERLHLHCPRKHHCYSDESDLEVSLEENKDVPADEKREEALLEYLQPPTNLKEWVIDGYGGSKFPKWVGNPLSFASLRKIHIIDCKKIMSLPLYIHDSPGKLDASISKSMLQRVCISGCQQLKSIAGLHNLHSLVELNISVCPLLQLLSEEGLPSKLQYLHIEGCQQLTSLPGMQNLTSLTNLSITDCPKLQIMVEDRLSSMPRYVRIVDCPALVNWCEIQKINCIQVFSSGNKLTISNTWEKIMHGFDDLTSIEHLHFTNSWHLLPERFSISILEELTIWGCMHIPLLSCLPALTSLQSLVIKDCPTILVVTDQLLPHTLNSLVVDSCEDLRRLQLAQQNRDALEVLHIVNCPRLTMVEGLNCMRIPPTSCLPALTSLQSLVIKDCPRILVVTDQLLPRTLNSLVVDSCEDLRRLQLAQQNRDALEVLQIVNCPRLTMVEGLNCIFFPKFLTIEQCPQLLLPHSGSREQRNN
uniref:Disease resistance protein RGA1 isoform X1 n=1 Tax=Elaeis guineensis var. tenera TaxID=51953 RepID=A0A6I9SD46_ELAGV|nr:putative disease resistance protein RGA1 isoform X1 [Elaeis guineensis]